MDVEQLAIEFAENDMFGTAYEHDGEFYFAPIDLSDSYPTPSFKVRWETLNGNVKTRTFTDADYDNSAQSAQEFADRIERFSGTQWVDIDQI